ncbi:hypothetical protein COU54_03440 [Candidatus Pacearchaeota archaeon CG10_big_fil_rev_8_21_14_0_10_31_24]|nr:MAG: hypothetical protein COU54_03440 [Candidatus Pacearchaeota archaeon CG10_big_fil_rev_8_21_14_0_10_31_24]
MVTPIRKVFNYSFLQLIMQSDLLKNIVTSIVGSQGASIVDILYNKKNVNEFIIAKKLKLTINQTRNLLYKLFDEGLVSFVRKKDNKKGGWYTYFWTLNSGKSLIKFRDRLLVSLKDLQNKFSSRKSLSYFYCKNCDIEYDEESALVHQYTCPECGEVLDIKNITDELKNYERDIIKLESLLAEVNKEVEIIGVKYLKAKNRKLQAEQVKKAKEREIKRVARKKISDAEKKLKGIVVKKKSKKVSTSKVKKVSKKKKR